jgi:hypothetical protein
MLTVKITIVDEDQETCLDDGERAEIREFFRDRAWEVTIEEILHWKKLK